RRRSRVIGGTSWSSWPAAPASTPCTFRLSAARDRSPVALPTEEGGSVMEKKIRRAIFVVAVSALAVGPAWADQTDRSAPAVRPSATPSAEQEYARGITARSAKDWAAAVAAFRKAVNMRPAYPEAWNELGYALRNQGRYSESLTAYDE